MGGSGRKNRRRSGPSGARSDIKASPGPWRFDFRSFFVMFGVSAIIGPINFVLGFSLWALVLSALPADVDQRRLLEGPLVVASQALIIGVTIFIAGYVVGRWSRVSYRWGYLLGILLAIATNPFVLLTFGTS